MLNFDYEENVNVKSCFEMVAYKILRIESEFPRKNRKDEKVHYTPELSSKEEHEIKK